MRPDNQDPSARDRGDGGQDGVESGVEGKLDGKLGGDDAPAARADDDDALEREIRRDRPFDLAEAIGRAAGGSLKGASPVPAGRQLLLEAKALLQARLDDADGALTDTLLARLADDPPLLDRHRGMPAAALRELLDGLLSRETLLADLVRETDARWGRAYDERPRFELPGRPTAADDPYTLAGVHVRLTALRDRL